MKNVTLDEIDVIVNKIQYNHELNEREKSILWLIMRDKKREILRKAIEETL